LVTRLTPERDFTLLDFDCDHMVAQALPVETAAVIGKALG
jgi:lipase